MAVIVAAKRTSPKTVIGDYSSLMDLAKYKSAIRPSHSTILKLNLSWTYFYPACSTPPWQLDGVLAKLKEGGYRNLFAVENETVVTNPQMGAKLNKWLGVLEKYGLEFTPLTDVEWMNYMPKSEMPALGNIFPEGIEIPKMFVGKNILHLPTMKCHGHTTITGAMKNAFGGLLRKKRHHCHKAIHEVIVDLLAIQKEIHPGIFATMDGTIAGDGAGPRTHMPHEKNLLLASSDSVAIDALAAKIMGFDPMQIPFIKLAHDAGLGCGDVAQLDLAGDDISDLNFHFKSSRSPVIFFDQMLRKGKLSSLSEKIIFHTPLFAACVFGSESYHDKFWYPAIGKGRIGAFSQTGWGKLFASYK